MQNNGEFREQLDNGREVKIAGNMQKILAIRSKILKGVLFAALVFSLLTFGVLCNEVFIHKSPTHSISVEIVSGRGSRQIADTLKQNHVIRSKWIFELYVILIGRASDLKPGNYLFSESRIPEIVRVLVTGSNETVITIPEGWSADDIGTYLEGRNLVTKKYFLNTIEAEPQYYRGSASIVNKFDFFKDKPLSVSFEGYLFPDTYRIFKNATPEDIATKMLENFDKKVDSTFRTEISRQGKTVFQIVTMASLIEKEVVSDEDRALVSGILWKRLALGIPLQVDATIAYITEKNTTRISRDDLAIDSPYNTYRYRGLPKGPITNPGLSAIRAAIHPTISSYFFYLSASDGKTIFSKTLEEHNTARIKYLMVY